MEDNGKSIEDLILMSFPHLIRISKVNCLARRWLLAALILYIGSVIGLTAQTSWQFEQNQREIERTNIHLQSTDAKVEQLISQYNAIDKQLGLLAWEAQTFHSVLGFIVSAVIANIVALFFLYLSKRSSIRTEDMEDLKDRLERIERSSA